MQMFHFEGDWINMVYTFFFAIGVLTIGMVAIVLLFAIIFGKIEQNKQKAELEKSLKMLDPIARKKRIEESKAELQDKIDALEKQLKENQKDGDKEKS